MENAGFLYAAFIIIWALVFGYVLFLVKRQAAIKRQLESLKGTAGESRGKDGQ